MADILHEREAGNTFLASDNAGSQARPLTVLLVADRGLVCAVKGQALASQPEIKQVVTARSYREAEKLAGLLLPDIIWLDVHLGRAAGIAEIGRLRKLSAASRILALADAEDEWEAFAAILAGAQGYCSKQEVDAWAIMPVIQMLTRDEYMLRPALLVRVMQLLRAAAIPSWR
jgi:DNA-binding NarL/FixJ family response regulator